MSLPTDCFLSDDPKQQRNNFNLLYKQVANGINDIADVYEFVDYSQNKLAVSLGSTTPGVGTYTLQEGRYVRNLNVVDYWFHLAWGAHTGVGNLIIQLPFTSDAVSSSGAGNFEGVIAPRVATAFPAGTYSLTIQTGNSDEAYVLAYGPGVRTLFPIAPNSAFEGHIRYIAEG